MTDGRTDGQTDRRRTKWSLSGALLRWRKIIRCRVTANLQRPQIKQYTVSNEGGGVFTKPTGTGYDINLTKYEAVNPTAVSDNYSSSGNDTFTGKSVAINTSGCRTIDSSITRTPPRHLVSPLATRSPWRSTMVIIVCATVTVLSSFVFYILHLLFALNSDL